MILNNANFNSLFKWHQIDTWISILQSKMLNLKIIHFLAKILTFNGTTDYADLL